jgi:MraZ protein
MQNNADRRLIGAYACTLDAKSRLKIPAPFRRLIPDGLFQTLVISKGKERCLNLYTQDEYEKILNDLANRPPGAERRDIQRFYSIKSKQLKVDGSGRVAIPPDFLAMIDNVKDVVVLGALSYLEIWKATDFEELSKRAEETYLRSDFER